MNTNARQYIRHPISIPIQVASGDVEEDELQVKDVSGGGLCFTCEKNYNAGDKVNIAISLCHPEFRAEGVVCWCEKKEQGYLIGVVFLEKDVFFALRMVEQICHIENYRQQMIKQSGQAMSTEIAAAEWIQKHASDFPNANH